jgi:hypothetical protein
VAQALMYHAFLWQTHWIDVTNSLDHGTMKRLFVILLMAVFPLSVWGQTSAKPATLQWRFKEGEKFWIDTQTRIEQLERSGVITVSNVVQMRTITSYVVKKVFETNFVELEAKIESTRYNNVNQTPEGEKMATLYGRLQGATFKIVLTPDRQVQKLDGYNEWVQKLRSMIQLSEVERLQQLIPEADVRNAVSEGFGFLPDHAVVIGQQWRKKSDLNLAPAGVLSCNLTYTYRGPDRGKDKITIESKEQGKFVPSATGTTPGAKTNFALDSRTGYILFNAQIGKMEQAEHVYQTQGLITIPSDVANALQNINVTTRVTVKQSLTGRSPR